MGILGWIVLGLLAGGAAKAVMGGREGMGCFGTLTLGVVGALVGGFLGGTLFNVSLGTFWDLRTWALAILGSCLCLGVYGLVTGRR